MKKEIIILFIIALLGLMLGYIFTVLFNKGV